jgi:predicted RNase H-like HicB family nuclease
MIEQPNATLFKAWLLRNTTGAWMAIATELVGCYALGNSESEALSHLTTAIPAFYAWLSQHDEYTPTISGPVRVEAAGTLDLAPGIGSVFLADDIESVNDEDLDWLLAVLGWAYDDLLRSARQRPETSAREALLAHVAMRQAEFLSYALGIQALTFSGAGLDRVAAARDAALWKFRATSQTQREGIREAAGQRWSLRTGLRASVLLARRANEELLKL